MNESQVNKDLNELAYYEISQAVKREELPAVYLEDPFFMLGVKTGLFLALKRVISILPPSSKEEVMKICKKIIEND